MTLRRIAKRVLKPVQPQKAAYDPNHHVPEYLQEFQDKSREFERVYEVRKRFVVAVDQPLVMVSQVQRSGGTLMSQLFDGHPEVHAHPHELYIGYPEKYNYPDLDLTQSPQQWYALLHEKPSLKNFRQGYQKHPDSAEYDKEDVFPFLLLPNLQLELFLHALAITPAKTQRDVLNAYWTSYFNAWLDNQNLYGEKKVVAGFVPRVNIDAGNIQRFFRDYPDGRIISIIREPKGWYGSSHRKGPENYPNPQVSLPVWIDSAQAMIRNKQQYGDRVTLIPFDRLLKDTEGVMRHLADWIGLTWHPILAEPTFQRQPIKANTAFSTTQYGVIDAPLKREKDVSAEDAQAIDTMAADLYGQVLALVDNKK
jgi:hypothetical protein